MIAQPRHGQKEQGHDHYQPDHRQSCSTDTAIETHAASRAWTQARTHAMPPKCERANACQDAHASRRDRTLRRKRSLSMSRVRMARSSTAAVCCECSSSLTSSTSTSGLACAPKYRSLDQDGLRCATWWRAASAPALHTQHQHLRLGLRRAISISTPSITHQQALSGRHRFETYVVRQSASNKEHRLK